MCQRSRGVPGRAAGCLAHRAQPVRTRAAQCGSGKNPLYSWPAPAARPERRPRKDLLCSRTSGQRCLYSGRIELCGAAGSVLRVVCGGRRVRSEKGGRGSVWPEAIRARGCAARDGIRILGGRGGCALSRQALHAAALAREQDRAAAGRAPSGGCTGGLNSALAVTVHPKRGPFSIPARHAGAGTALPG